MKKKNPPLTRAQKELLLVAKESDYSLHFPNHSRAFLREVKKELDVPVEVQIEADRYKIHEKKKNSLLSKKYNELVSQNEELNRKLEAHFLIGNEFFPHSIEPISDVKSEATAVLVASDWHIEENISSGSVNGLNEFNLNEARKRVNNFFVNSAELIKKEQKSIEINNVVLALLGDFISGNIHEELLETAEMEPVYASIEAENLIAGGIDYLLKNTDCNLIIPCCAGNHSRITKKIRHSTETGNALETMIYSNLSWHYKDEKRVNFVLQEGYFIYLDIYGKKIRFHHGHNMRYNGGVGGIGIPVNKAINEWNKSKKADLDVFGHWHQKLDGGNYVSNGSLIGYNAFALSLKASYEKPTQTFFLFDKEEGKTIVAPIFL